MFIFSYFCVEKSVGWRQFARNRRKHLRNCIRCLRRYVLSGLLLCRRSRSMVLRVAENCTRRTDSLESLVYSVSLSQSPYWWEMSRQLFARAVLSNSSNE